MFREFKKKVVSLVGLAEFRPRRRIQERVEELGRNEERERVVEKRKRGLLSEVYVGHNANCKLSRVMCFSLIGTNPSFLGTAS